MNTPTHLLIAAAALAEPGQRARNIAAIAGALVPDLPLYVMWAGARLILGMPEREVWDRLYWTATWQGVDAALNSLPLYLMLLLLAFAFDTGWLKTFVAAALLHLAFDFPFHHDDAHRHFWPISDWRFHSPFSYWNPAFHGDVIGMLEIALALALIAILWRRFTDWRVRAALALPPLSYAAVPLYFGMM